MLWKHFLRSKDEYMDVTRLLTLLRTCVTFRSLKQGKLVHQKILSYGLQGNTALCKNLIHFYFICHSYGSAKLVFQTISYPLDISLWNGLMASYTKNSLDLEALELFQKLINYPFLKPDCYTYPSVLKACGRLGRIGLGTMIHGNLIKTGLAWDVFVASSLVSMYAKCVEFEHAIQLFDEMPHRDVGCWNTIISCHFQHGQAEKALEMFEKMRNSGFQPNSLTIAAVISSCTRLLELETGSKIHMELVQSGVLSDDFIYSALVDMYGKCGCLEKAEEVFEQIQRKNVIAWNSLLSGHSLKGDSKSCVQLFSRMNDEGIKPTLTTLSTILMASSKSAQLQHGKFIHGYVIRNRIEVDIHIYSSLINFYFNCGRVVAAENVFKFMPKTSVVSWNVMISGYITVGNNFEALQIYEKMMEACVKPDAITFTNILSACLQLAALEKGREIHNCLINWKFDKDEKVMGSVLDMYAKCGSVSEAEAVFYQLPKRDIKAWTSMITAYGSHGRALEALKLFDEMMESDAEADEVAFLSVLSACGHAGLVNEGYHYFDQMVSQYGIKPKMEHYSCLIDLLGRGGRLAEAYEILRGSSETRRDVGLLSTLLSACRLHNNITLGIEIGKILIEIDPDDPSVYVILSNMYAFLEKWNEVRKMRVKMKEVGRKKNPGCSWIEVEKRIQPFFVNDRSNSNADSAYKCLGILAGHMEKDELYLWDQSNHFEVL